MFSVSLSLTEPKLSSQLPTLPIFFHVIYSVSDIMLKKPPQTGALSMPPSARSLWEFSFLFCPVLCLPLLG